MQIFHFSWILFSYAGAVCYSLKASFAWTGTNTLRSIVVYLFLSADFVCGLVKWKLLQCLFVWTPADVCVPADGWKCVELLSYLFSQLSFSTNRLLPFKWSQTSKPILTSDRWHLKGIFLLYNLTLNRLLEKFFHSFSILCQLILLVNFIEKLKLKKKKL